MGADQQLFVEFFAWTESGIADFDITVRIFAGAKGEAGKLYHFEGEIDNFDRFTHFEQKEVTR